MYEKYTNLYLIEHTLTFCLSSIVSCAPLKNVTSIEKGYWALAAISFFWGTTWFVSKLTIQYIPPLLMTGLRQSIAGVAMILFFVAKGSFKLPHKRLFLFHTLNGFLLFTCSNGLTTWAIEYIPSFLGALISCLTPFVMVLVGAILFHEKIKPKVLVGMLIGFVGIAILLSSYRSDIAAGEGFLFGVLLTLIAVLTWTSGTFLATRNRINTDPFQGVAWQMLIGGLLLLLSAFITKQEVPLASISWQGWGLLLYLIAVGSIFCFICYIIALRTLPISLVTIYVYINPMVALLLGVLLLNEHISITIILGAAITLGGIYLVKRYSRP